jgi:hypothetical protein
MAGNDGIRTQDNFMSSRASACHLLSQPAVGGGLRARLRQISAQHPRWGWRKAHTITAREGRGSRWPRVRRVVAQGMHRRWLTGFLNP